MEALFAEGRIFSEEPNNTFTNQLLRGMQCAKLYWFGNGQVGAMEWPTSPRYLRKPLEYGRKLYDAALAFFKLNYPDHDWRHKFGAFN